ncbi:muraminidase [Pelistega indica]|uniref:Lysozyme n=2 Tax=Pelistega indica TaxID=1414851 RepID=V8FTY6_9BURK|nr:muraminidase [Pelistega indica]
MTHQTAVATSAEGIKFISRWEGFSAKPYRDVVGVPTIGFGATYYPNGKRVTLNDAPITKEQGIELLKHTVQDFEDAVNTYVTVTLNQNQFDAIVSFAYNVGIEAFKKSTLLKLLNKGQPYAAAQEFLKWNKAGGKSIAGLSNRRKAEKELFLR